MNLFTNEIIKNKYKKFQLCKYIGLTLLMLTILIMLGSYLFSKSNAGKPMNEFIVANKLETDKKASINVVEPPIYIGNYSKEDKIYFLVKDGEYSYVTRISEKNYHKYQNATVENPIIMSGTTKKTSETLMMAIINAINKDAEEKDYVDANWFVDYLGLLYLDEGEEPPKTGLIFSLALMGGISIFILITGLYLKFHYEHEIAYMSLEDIEKLDRELNSKDTIYYPTIQVAITKNHLISLKNVFIFIPLHSISWIYSFNLMEGEEAKRRALKIITKDLDEKDIAKSSIEEKEFDDFYKELRKHNKNMLVGYTKENVNKFAKDTKN